VRVERPDDSRGDSPSQVYAQRSSRSGLTDVEIGFENLGDPMPAFFEVRPAGVVDGQVLRFQNLADPAGDLFQVQPGEGAGIGWNRAIATP